MTVEMLQHTFEHDVMLTLFKAAKPKRVLEIGVWEGGTLQHWLRRGITVVAVDTHIYRDDQFFQWAEDAKANLVLVQGSSDSPGVVERVAAEAPYDFVFIDGDHGYGAVRSDWENYRPMVEPGGIVAFHDVHRDCGAAELWKEIKATFSHTVEILDGPESDRGIGMVWC